MGWFLNVVLFPMFEFVSVADLKDLRMFKLCCKWDSRKSLDETFVFSRGRHMQFDGPAGCLCHKSGSPERHMKVSHKSVVRVTYKRV